MSLDRFVSDEEFAGRIERAMNELPEKYMRQLDNVAITYEDEPTLQQLTKQGVRRGSLLLGLYEGIPLTARYSSSYSGVLPDKITLFKHPLQQISLNETVFQAEIKHTLWHEIAHHFGLNHKDIGERETGQ